MNLLAFGWWIIFDLCSALFFLWAIRKIPNRNLRFAFLYLLGAGAIYFNALFAKWLSPLGDSNPLLLTRVIFTSGILIHSAFGFFVVAFGGNPAWSKHLVFRFIQASLLAAAIMAMATPLIIVDVAILDHYPKFQAVHGILHLPLIAFLATVGLTAIGLFYLSWRRCRIPFQKFQIGATLAVSGFIFVCMTITNGLIPAITQKSYLSILGGIFPMLFFATVLYLLANSEAISLKREFARLLGQGLSLHEDNQVALREVIQGLRSLLHKGAEQISRRITFRVKPGTLIQVTLEHTAGNRLESPNHSVVARSLTNSLQHLYTENQRMFFSLIRAESLLQEKWLSDEIARTPKVGQPGMSTYAAVDENLAEFSEFWGQEMICATPEFFQLLQQLARRQALTQPVVITGEASTGKAMLCRALHHRRGGKKLLERSGRLDTVETIHQKSLEAITAAKTGDTAVLIRHCDELGVEGMKTLWTLVDMFSDQIRFYLTASENLSSKITEQGLLARLDTLALKSIPLRSRPQDTEFLALLFARKAAQATGHTPPEFSVAVMQKLRRHSWPGNIAELRESIEIAVATSVSREIAEIPLLRRLPATEGQLSPLEAGERTLIAQFLTKNNFNKNRTRRELGITINTLKAKMLKYGLMVPAQKA